MGSEMLVQGHAFDFETGICSRCGMSEIEFEKQIDPLAIIRFATERRPRLSPSVGSHHLVCFPARGQFRGTFVGDTSGL
jgi:hypothetical protein